FSYSKFTPSFFVTSKPIPQRITRQYTNWDTNVLISMAKPPNLATNCQRTTWSVSSQKVPSHIGLVATSPYVDRRSNASFPPEVRAWPSRGLLSRSHPVAHLADPTCYRHHRQDLRDSSPYLCPGFAEPHLDDQIFLCRQRTQIR